MRSIETQTLLSNTPLGEATHVLTPFQTCEVREGKQLAPLPLEPRETSMLERRD